MKIHETTGHRDGVRFGLVLALLGWWVLVDARASAAQSVSFWDNVPATIPSGSFEAVSSDTTGIYIAGVTGVRQIDTFVRKYDKDGAEIWARGFGGPVQITAIAAVDVGVYVTGYTFNYTLPGQQGTAYNDAFVRLYDTFGNEVWTRQFGFVPGATSGNYGYGIGADASGVYIAGFHDGRAGPSGGFLRKYNHRGSEVWTRRLERSMLSGVAVDGSGVYLGGIVENFGLFLIKYDSAGVEIWNRSLAERGNLRAMTANSSGIYLTGYDNRGPFLRRLDSDGNDAWYRSGMTGTLVADASSVYLVGDVTRAQPGQCASGSSDVFVSQYDANGNEFWTRQFGTYRSDMHGGIALSSNSVLIPGTQYPGPKPFVAKLGAALVPMSPSEPQIRNECVVNAASEVGGAVSPGEIVTIFGSAMGPADAVSARFTEDRTLPTLLAETRVLFGGIAAPLLHVSSTQIKAIVPNALTIGSDVAVQVEHAGAVSSAVIVPVLKAHPGIFGINDGQAFVLNEDGSANSSSNPAPRGSIIAIFATGGGETDPPSPDGKIVADPAPRLTTPVVVAFTDPALGCDGYFGSVVAEYAGGIPGSLGGLLQINVRIPEALPPGDWFPQLFVGAAEAASATSVHLSVR